MSTDEYVPSVALLRIAWSDYCQSMDACNAWVRPDDVDPRAEFDRFLARVRRDAAREALDGLAKAELDRVANLGKHSYPAQIAQGIAQAAWNHKWKNYGGAHPEETP